MYLHVFLFQWKPEATPDLIEKAIAGINALQHQVPGLLTSHTGHNDSSQANGNTFGGVMTFASREAYLAYVTHPAHASLVSWLMPIIHPTELDFAY